MLDALDPMPVAARNPWCGVSRLPVALVSTAHDRPTVC
jgi:hypothetical protein